MTKTVHRCTIGGRKNHESACTCRWLVQEHSIRPLGTGTRLQKRPFDLGSITLIRRPSQHLAQPHEPLQSLVVGLPCVKHGCVQCSYLIQGFQNPLTHLQPWKICSKQRVIKMWKILPKKQSRLSTIISFSGRFFFFLLFFFFFFERMHNVALLRKFPADFVITNND